MRKWTEQERKLVDICYSLVLACTDQRHAKIFCKKTNEEKAEWVRKQLVACGFPNTPCGSSWGYLTGECDEKV